MDISKHNFQPNENNNNMNDPEPNESYDFDRFSSNEDKNVKIWSF